MSQHDRPPVIETRGLSRFYGQVRGLSDVTVSIGPGMTGLLGPNGSGKSTFLWTVAGQLRPTDGMVNVYGAPVPGGSRLRRRVGVCPEPDAFYWEMTARQFVTSLGKLSGLRGQEARSRAQEVLMRVGLVDVMDRRIRTYSRGMRQRVKLAQALVGDPDLLLLDEPLSGTDPVARRDLIELIRALVHQGKDVLVSSHVLPEVEALTDRVVVLVHGRVVARGRVEEIRALLDRYPHEVLIVCDRARDLARQMLTFEDVIGCKVSSGKAVTLTTGRPGEFYRRLAEVLSSGNYHVGRIETLNDSLEAVFRYLAQE